MELCALLAISTDHSLSEGSGQNRLFLKAAGNEEGLSCTPAHDITGASDNPDLMNPSANITTRHFSLTIVFFTDITCISPSLLFVVSLPVPPFPSEISQASLVSWLSMQSTCASSGDVSPCRPCLGHTLVRDQNSQHRWVFLSNNWNKDFISTALVLSVSIINVLWYQYWYYLLIFQSNMNTYLGQGNYHLFITTCSFPAL